MRLVYEFAVGHNPVLACFCFVPSLITFCTAVAVLSIVIAAAVVVIIIPENYHHRQYHCV
jgi:hypothetical protein